MESETDYTLPIDRTNLWANLIFFGVLLSCLAAHALLWGWSSLVGMFRRPVFLPFIPLFLVGIFAHEGLHALGWKVFGRIPWSAIKFGVLWKGLMPYAHCLVPLRATAYRLGTILPALVTGVVPLACGLGYGVGRVTLYGAFFLGAASGDMLILWISRAVPARALLLDHPSLPGCRVVREGE